MNATAANLFLGHFSPPRNGSEKERFREIFQRSLRSCLQRGFSLEESFGMIWVETWEEIALTEEEQSSLYDELIRWAKKPENLRQNEVNHSYPPQLFTENSSRLGVRPERR